jgi:hypothetical protein
MGRNNIPLAYIINLGRADKEIRRAAEDSR